MKQTVNNVKPKFRLNIVPASFGLSAGNFDADDQLAQQLSGARFA